MANKTRETSALQKPSNWLFSWQEGLWIWPAALASIEPQFILLMSFDVLFRNHNGYSGDYRKVVIYILMVPLKCRGRSRSRPGVLNIHIRPPKTLRGRSFHPRPVCLLPPGGSSLSILWRFFPQRSGGFFDILMCPFSTQTRGKEIFYPKTLSCRGK